MKMRGCKLCTFVHILMATAFALAYWGLAVLCAPLIFTGCAGIGDGAKVVEGADLTLGVQFPYADCDTMAVVNWLTGFRVTVAENARARVKYTCAETNDYFGMITTRTHKTIDATITPTVEDGEDEGGATATNATEEAP